MHNSGQTFYILCLMAIILNSNCKVKFHWPMNVFNMFKMGFSLWKIPIVSTLIYHVTVNAIINRGNFKFLEKKLIFLNTLYFTKGFGQFYTQHSTHGFIGQKNIQTFYCLLKCSKIDIIP